MNEIFDKIKSVYYKIKYGIENLILWFPVVWKDRNWDHYFIYVMVRHKLHLTEQLIRNHGHHIRNIKDADDIKLCINLLDRLIEDDYYESAFKNHDKKWGEVKVRFEDCDDNPEMQEFHIDRPNANTSKEKEKEKKDFFKAYKRETDLREQDLDMLFKYMRRKIQCWWD